MSICPWYITAHAVRHWRAITRRPDEPGHFDDARAELIELAAATWERYERGGKAPRITRTGAYQYRSAYTRVRGARTQVDLIVSMEQRAEGSKAQLVDVHWGGERSNAGQ